MALGDCKRTLTGVSVNALACALAASLAACGGSGGEQAALPAQAPLQLSALAPQTDGNPAMTPMFHAAPLVLQEPADVDADSSGLSATRAPDRYQLSPEAQQINTARLTREALNAYRASARTAQPMAGANTTVVAYTPAQIRAAYSMPSLPSAADMKTAAGAASLGAGQTIYIIGAYDNPTVSKDLAAFNAKFGLPTCPSTAISTAAALPLAAADPGAGCTLSIVYSAAGSAAPVAGKPAYDAGWAAESAMDVQWAHATAPLARIILIEAPDSGTISLSNAIMLANRMGPGIVSMSFGAREGSWTARYESTFQGKDMSYVASAGDAGTQVNWPASSPRVLAVGGTTLNYSATGTRSETAWSLTGGGVSSYTARPSYQDAVKWVRLSSGVSVVPRMRAVSDVSFNADPRTGQYVAVTTAGAQTPGWYSYGGTSISAPQWAGMLAVANSTRALSGKAPVNLAQNILYNKIASVPGIYAGAFYDVKANRNGNCLDCNAVTGYDLPTGLGSPVFGNLLGALVAN
ncbi:MAG: S53 family peptidase [Pseudomonadota bacterium]